MKPEFNQWMITQKQGIESILYDFLPKPEKIPASLNKVMHYAVLGHGKRIRPLLVIAASEMGEVDKIALRQRIVAVEFIHTYSLIHDDLPAMDNDDLRHGKPTCHKVYGEGIALLAGDVLQTQAFECLSHDNNLPIHQNLISIQLLAKASGFTGMAGGQALDLQNTGKKISLSELICMHEKKTGALITCSILLGFLACRNYCPEIAQHLKKFGQKIGLAFQIIDDILDYESNTEILGKTAGKDQQEHKATFISLLGLEAAKQYATQLITEAIPIVEKYRPNSQHLIDIACYILQRKL